LLLVGLVKLVILNFSLCKSFRVKGTYGFVVLRVKVVGGGDSIF